MEQQILTTMTPQDIINLVKIGIMEADKEKANNILENRTYSINQASKLLGRSFTTVKNMIITGKLETTSDGKRIIAKALNNYLKQTG